MPVLSGERWQSSGSTTTITWSFAERNYPTLKTTYSGYLDFASLISDTYRGTLQSAFNAWEAVANIDFVQVADSASVNIRVGNISIDGRPAPGGTSTLATTHSWWTGIYYKAAEIYFDVDAYDGANLYETALHEIGHALGLDHSPQQSAVMYYLTNSQNLSGTLTSDDLLGIRTIYGVRGSAPPTTPTTPTTPPTPPTTPDDFAGSTATTGSISAGGSIMGHIGAANDVDWFRITLTAGRTYRVDLEGSPSGAGTLADPYLELRNSAGVVMNSYDDGGTGYNSRGQFTATTSGTYYLAASSYDPDILGSYRLSVADVTTSTPTPPTTPVSDDYAAAVTTTGAVVVGGLAAGRIEAANDSDWFRVTLTAGHIYRFDLEGQASGRGTLEDPYLRLRDSTGTQIAAYDDGGAGVNSRGQFTAATGGTYYLAASSYDPDLVGSYQLSVTDLTPATTLPNQQLLSAASYILRSTTGAAVSDIAQKLAAGVLTTTTMIGELIKAADATTSVATLSYEFFTGKIPSQGGIDYLVSTSGGNANNLNSSYYQAFSMENRYINFAVNLGAVGEGRSAFQVGYGHLTLLEATKQAYNTIFGSAPTDAKAHALIDTRADYFAAYGGDGVTGLGTKAAMVGWLLAEAAKADLGIYSKSNDAFLTDLADGATFAVDIIGVYGRPEYIFLG